jgi:hypothetical protein
MALPSLAEMEAYIRQAAVARGIDPDAAVAIARSEGLSRGTWQSRIMLDYGRERSYGPFQLHVDPRPGKGGMGNDFVRATGLDPSNPAYWKQTIDFGLDQAAKGGWGPWFGRANAEYGGRTGMGLWDGINNGRAAGVSPVANVATQPGAYTAGEYVPPQTYDVATGAPAADPGFTIQPADDPTMTSFGPPAKPNAYQAMMARGMEKEGRSQREMGQVMSQTSGGSGGFKLPNIGALMGGGGGKGGGGGGKSGGGGAPAQTAPVSPSVSPVFEPAAAEAAAAVAPPLSARPIPKPRPQSQNMSLPPMQGPTAPYWGVHADDPEQAQDNAMGFGASFPDDTARLPTPGVTDGMGPRPYDRSKSPTWDINRKRFMPPTRPR